MIEQALYTDNHFAPISLAEMNEVSLLKRTDTKFVLPRSLLPSILEGLEKDYRVLTISSKRIMSYKSLYFDTPDLKFYHDHHRGRVRRTKIRIRQYVDSELFFLESKIKDGRGKTHKTRISLDGFEEPLRPDSKSFITDITGLDYDLKSSLWNKFNRITLVSIANKERATIDFNLCYQIDDKKMSLPSLCIVELKQEKHNRSSRMYEKLRLHNLRSCGISKYCVGMIQLYPGLKHNNFIPKLILIKKITARNGSIRNTSL